MPSLDRSQLGFEPVLGKSLTTQDSVEEDIIHRLFLPSEFGLSEQVL